MGGSSATRACQATGMWSGSAPTCQSMLLLPCMCVCTQWGQAHYLTVCTSAQETLHLGLVGV